VPRACIGVVHSLGSVSYTDIRLLPPLRVLIAHRTPKLSVFLIDPVSQVVQKKQIIHRDFANDADLLRILAIKDRMFFICEGPEETMRITIVAGPGPNSVIRHFNLDLTGVVC